MRDFLNAILSFIGSESLTDDEFDTVEATLPLYDQATYDDLSRICESRGSVNDSQERLVNYYNAKGVEVSEADTGSSDIFVGSVLCD